MGESINRKVERILRLRSGTKVFSIEYIFLMIKILVINNLIARKHNIV
jgi:hypothetical protein